MRSSGCAAQPVHAHERAAYARVLREFCRGAITNREYERLVEEIDATDAAVREIDQFLWMHYCDLRTHTLRGDDALAASSKRYLARAVLLLRSGAPVAVSRASVLFTWMISVVSKLAALVASIWSGHVLLGIAAGLSFLWTLGHYIPARRRRSDPDAADFWPFQSPADLAKAQAELHLLGRGAR